MKPIQTYPILKCALLACLIGSAGALNSHGQYTFSSGSTGLDGPMNITTDTMLDLPTNGVFNCTTITIASGATLKFRTNALNTPIYLLATGDVTIAGTIDVSGSLGTSVAGGAGGPGGFAGGNPAYANLPAGDGHGPGAGRNGTVSSVGSASYGTAGSSYLPTTNIGTTYGSPLLVPLVGGSGGGGRSDGQPGAGGGGALLIASNTRIDVSGTISATSSSFHYENYDAYGFGSGGAIRLAAPLVTGAGTLNASGGLDSWNYNYTLGGAGRIRIDCMDRRGLVLNLSGTSTIGANMVAIPANLPRLDITQVASNSIPVGTGAAVSFTLPQGSSTNQSVTVQASNFGSVVPIRLVLTPDNGPSSSYDTSIDNTNNPASVTVLVVLPVNVQVWVNAWTR